MHDAKGRELIVGDLVMVPMRITALHEGTTHCNVNLESVATMPNGNPEEKEHTTSLAAINTRQVLRARSGDELSFAIVRVGDHCVRIG